MSEADYQAHSKEIASEFEDPTVEGLYETQVHASNYAHTHLFGALSSYT